MLLFSDHISYFVVIFFWRIILICKVVRENRPTKTLPPTFPTWRREFPRASYTWRGAPAAAHPRWTGTCSLQYYYYLLPSRLSSHFLTSMIWSLDKLYHHWTYICTSFLSRLNKYTPNGIKEKCRTSEWVKRMPNHTLRTVHICFLISQFDLLYDKFMF